MKKIIAIFLTAVIMFSYVLPLVSFAAHNENPFENFDKNRAESIKLGLSNDYIEPKPDIYKSSSKGNRYAVKFKSTASLSEIYECVCGYDYTLLSSSEQKMFAIKIDNLTKFRDQYGSLVDFIEEDSRLSLSAAVNDPLSDTQWELDSLNVYDGWDIATGKKDVVVAVLDSGIYRQHEDFYGVQILSGYDAVNDTNGVDADYNGHGTKVASIIAASNNNSIGMASVGSGLTILPIRVSDSTGFVYSTDFIQALYFAVDSGANIINMSFGGYVYSAAEEAAAEYAASKGCILVSAAGNEGTDVKYAGMKSYPASYANVISVGSIDVNGEICPFSQYNDSVDLVAPGTELTVANVEGGYEKEQGSSFSTAYVSAVLGLAMSAIDDDVSFTADQFLTLVASFNTNDRSDTYGYGPINVAEVLGNINRPLYSGVYDGGVYHRNIAIQFNRGTALLDGVPFVSGDIVLFSGKHRLTITDGDFTTEIGFITDNIPLTYEYSVDSNKASISFIRGSATLDGVPYASSTPITSNGKHCFVITGPYGNSETYEFECDFVAPTIFGVENGGYYVSPVCITATDSDSLSLNGNPIFPNTVVATNGSYTLSATKNGVSNTVHFTVAIPNTAVYDASVASAKIAIDEEYGKVFLYNDILSGMRILQNSNLSKTVGFIKTPYGITEHYIYDKYFVMIHQNSISVVMRQDLANGYTDSLLNYSFVGTPKASIPVHNQIVYISVDESGSYSARSINIENGKEQKLADFTDSFEFLTYSANEYMLCTANGIVCVYDSEWTKKYKYSTGIDTSYLVASGNVTCIGNSVFDIYEKKLLFTINADETPMHIDNGVLITDHALYNINDGVCIGKYEIPITDIYFSGDNTVYKYLSTLKIETIANNERLTAENALIKLNAADCSVSYSSSIEQLSVLQQNVLLPSTSNINNAVIAFENSVICGVSLDEKCLHFYNTETLQLIRTQRLRFSPSSIYSDGKKLYVSFKDGAYVYTMNSLGDTGIYHNCARPYTKIIVSNNVLFGLTEGGDLYSFSFENPNTGAIAVIKSQTVVGFDVNNDCIYAYLKPGAISLLYQISKDGFNVLASATINTDSNKVIVTDDIVYVGNRAFSAENLKAVSSFPQDVRYADSRYILTETGLYSTASFLLLGSHNHNTALPLFDNSYNYYNFDGNALSKIHAHGKDLSTLPEIKGIMDGETLQGPATISFPYGAVFIDNVLINSGDAIENGGRHTLTAVLPFGITKTYSFYIEAVITRIGLSYSKSMLSVNESLSATVSAYPITTVNVDTVFEASNDNVVVYEDGTVIGVSPGECTITATTLDGSHSATFSFTVTDSKIVFDSSYFKEEADNVISNIAPGTSVEVLLSAVATTYGNVIPTTKDGIQLNTGIISTDMKVLLYDINGNTIDERALSVLCDIDCDGYITANDYFMLEVLASQPEDMTPAVKYSADTDRNGNIDVFDLLTVKEHILGQNTIVETVASARRIARAQPNLIMPKTVSPNTTFTAGLTLTDAQNVSGISGRVCFDSSVFTATKVEIISTEAESFYSIQADGIHFFTNCNPSLETQVVALVSFSVTEDFNGNEAFVSFEDIELYDGSSAICGTVKVSPSFAETYVPEITIFNMPAFTFDSETTYYNLAFPTASSAVYVAAYPEEMFSITGNTSFLEGTAEFSAITETTHGEIRYNFVCTADTSDTPITNNTDNKINDNAFLSSIEISGGTVSPQFDKSITEYYVVCANTHDVVMSAVAESAQTVVYIGKYDPETESVTIKCTAESGAVKEYVIHLMSESPIKEEPLPSADEHWIWVIVTIIVSVLLIFLVVHQSWILIKNKT